MTENIEPTVNDVNELLEEAFGDTKGNYMYASPGFAFVDGKRGYVTHFQNLGLIVKNGLFGKKEIGCFTEFDGSALTLYGRGFLWRNRIGARKYAASYEKKFEKEVRIRINGQDQSF
jgi:hypothetical protein|tara:strand:+ start:1472 stop:1822 length:351 start_codon:yes stop_codon:yes gene_type:complete